MKRTIKLSDILFEGTELKANTPTNNEKPKTKKLRKEKTVESEEDAEDETEEDAEENEYGHHMMSIEELDADEATTKANNMIRMIEAGDFEGARTQCEYALDALTNLVSGRGIHESIKLEVTKALQNLHNPRYAQQALNNINNLI